jgi:dephospho-CoA kinase
MDLNLPKIIGITGKKYSGKDTIGEYLINKYGYIRIGFADALKDICALIFGFNKEQLYGDKKEIIDNFWGITPRKAFQEIGTKIFRKNMDEVIPDIGENLWVIVVEKKIKDMMEKNPESKFVITDLRFSNESNFIKKFGGFQIRVNRTNIHNNLYSLHESEKNIDKLNVDYEIYNNDTIENLYLDLDNLFNNMNYKTITSFSQISIDKNTKTLIVLDIDDTIITMKNLDKKWWNDKFDEFIKDCDTYKEANYKVLENWAKLVEHQTVELKDKEHLPSFLENNKNSVICLTSRNQEYDEITINQLKNLNIYLPVFHCETNKGNFLEKLIKNNYNDYENIIFVDDIIKNIINVNNVLKNKKVSSYLML